MSSNITTKKGALLWNIKKIISKGDYNYALILEHPNCTKNGYVLLHRIIMENFLGRLLNADEIVHHKNDDKKDNRIENLQLMDRKVHNKHHGLEHGRLWVRLKCPWCKKEFELERNKSFLQKPSKYRCTCCSNKCRGKLYRFIQMHGVTEQVEDAISENLLSEFRKYSLDNSEETTL